MYTIAYLRLTSSREYWRTNARVLYSNCSATYCTIGLAEIETIKIVHLWCAVVQLYLQLYSGVLQYWSTCNLYQLYCKMYCRVTYCIVLGVHVQLFATPTVLIVLPELRWILFTHGTVPVTMNSMGARMFPGSPPFPNTRSESVSDTDVRSRDKQVSFRMIG